MKDCEEYCGIACIDGSCPRASGTKDQRGKILCENCPYNHGCIDCTYRFENVCIIYGRKINEVKR